MLVFTVDKEQHTSEMCVKPAHTLYTYSSWLSSDSVVPSSLIRGVKANPNSFFSPLSLAERKHITINTHRHAASTQHKPYLCNSTCDPIRSNKPVERQMIATELHY